MDFRLEGKVALVTGGSHGIGLAIAELLYDEGCKVAICARDRTRLNAFCSGRGWTMGIEFDALEPDTISKVVETVAAAYSGIDILVNNVGGGGRWGTDVVEETTLSTWADVYTKNAAAAVHFTTLVIPHMRRNLWGRVVTVASIFGKESGGRPWFMIAKSAEIALMKSLSQVGYLVQDGITFNSVAPGHIEIPGTGSDEEKAPTMGTAEDVAAVVTFLCSNQAKHINGACVTVDGGESRSF